MKTIHTITLSEDDYFSFIRMNPPRIWKVVEIVRQRVRWYKVIYTPK